MWAMALISALIGLCLAGYLAYYVKKQPYGTDRMRELSEAIQEGARAFLNREYRMIAIYMACVSIILFLVGYITHKIHWASSLTFLFGAFLSLLAGNIGMRIDTAANARTAEGLRKDFNRGFDIAFSAGAVMGLCVSSFGLLGVTIVFLLVTNLNFDVAALASIFFGFQFGASSVALFARVGGGIYTKAADVGADIVGKVEENIPEDDPRNPAVIADNVGDNVGDCAGMGADLYESYVGSIIAAITIGFMAIHFGYIPGATYLSNATNQLANLPYYPLYFGAIGLISAIIGIFVVKGMKKSQPFTRMNTGLIVSSVIMGFLSVLTVHIISQGAYTLPFAVPLIGGLIVGVVIGISTQIYTSDEYKYTRDIAKASLTGAATTILEGMAVGMLSAAIPVIMVAIAMISSYFYAGVYGIALAAIGMLSTLAMSLAMDAYGPVADNAAGIAEMAGLGRKIREDAEALDAVGNTTAAIGKGFAIGSAALTALAFFATYTQSFPKEIYIALSDPRVAVGLFIGALMPFLFSALAIRAVGRAAEKMVEEVRRQFKEHPEILEGKRKPDYARCVDISTKWALREMILPTLMAVIVPIVVGICPGLGAEAVGGLISGAIASGFILALYMANAGGAWDNAKKYIEKGNLGGKGSDAHKASVIGDTVGDPLKDTAGPSLNILIKLMSIVALLFAPIFFI